MQTSLIKCLAGSCKIKKDQRYKSTTTVSMYSADIIIDTFYDLIGSSSFLCIFTKYQLNAIYILYIYIYI